MKKQRKQLVIMLLLLVLLVAGYFGLRKYNESQQKEEETAPVQILLDIDGSQVTELSYYYEGEPCNLVKEDNIWKLKEDKGLAIKQSLIDTMILNVSNLEISTQIENPTDLSEYGLQTPSNVITIKAGDTVHELQVGDENTIVSKLYVLADDSDTVYLVGNAISNSFNHSKEDLVEETAE